MICVNVTHVYSTHKCHTSHVTRHTSHVTHKCQTSHVMHCRGGGGGHDVVVAQHVLELQQASAQVVPACQTMTKIAEGGKEIRSDAKGKCGCV